MVRAGVEGQGKFCKRLWTLVQDHLAAGAAPALDPKQLSDAGSELRRKAHETLQKADDDYGRRVQFNTVVSAVHELVNQISRMMTAAGADQIPAADRAAVHEALKIGVLVLSPIAPHVTQELWSALGEKTLLVEERWPAVDETALVQHRLQLAVQVNGKVRGQIEIDADADQAAVQAAALENDNVSRFIADKTLRKVIYVPGKLLNLVVA